MAVVGYDIIAATNRVVVPLTGTNLASLQIQLVNALTLGGWSLEGQLGDGSYKLLSQQSPWLAPGMPPSDYILQCMVYIGKTGSALTIRGANSAETAVQNPSIPVTLGVPPTGYNFLVLVTGFSFTLYIPGLFSGGGIACMAGVPMVPPFQQVRTPHNSPQVQEAIYCIDASSFRQGFTSPQGAMFCCYQSAMSTLGEPQFWTEAPGRDEPYSFQLLGLANGPNLFYDATNPTFTDPTKWATLFAPLRMMWGNQTSSLPTLKGFLFDCVFCSKPFAGDSQILVDQNPMLTMNVFANNNVGTTGPTTVPGSLLVCSAGGTYNV